MDVDRNDMTWSDRTDKNVGLRRMEVAAWSAEYVVVLTRALSSADTASANKPEYSAHPAPCQTRLLRQWARSGLWGASVLGFADATREAIPTPDRQGGSAGGAWGDLIFTQAAQAVRLVLLQGTPLWEASLWVKAFRR